MNRSTRRAVLVLLPAAALSACGLITTTTTNGVTTITVNVAQLNNWGQAILNAGTMLAPLIPGVGPAVMAILNLVSSDLAAVNKTAGGSVSLTFDSTSVPAALTSLLADGQKLIGTVSPALPAAASSVATEAQTVVNALQTVVSVLAATLGSVAAVKPVMTEAQALQVLGVTR